MQFFQQLHPFQQEPAIGAAKIIVQKKHQLSFAQRFKLFSQVLQLILLVLFALGTQTAIIAAIIAVAARFHIHHIFHKISQIITGNRPPLFQKGRRYVLPAKGLFNHDLQLFDVSRAGVVKELAGILRDIANDGSAGDYDYLFVFGADIRR